MERSNPESVYAGYTDHALNLVGAAFTPSAHPVTASLQCAERAEFPGSSSEARLIAPAVGPLVTVAFLSLHRHCPLFRRSQ